MSILDRSDLEASSLADLHAIADQMGLDGFRRLRKAELIDAILGTAGGGSASAEHTEEQGTREEPAPRRRRGLRARLRPQGPAEEEREADSEVEPEPELAAPEAAVSEAAVSEAAAPEAEKPAASERQREAGTKRRGGEARGGEARGGEARGGARERTAEGVVEVLENGSAFLRAEDGGEDIYISAAQVRRCELVEGDRVSGPVRMPRRSERHPSLVRIDTINGEAADAVSGGERYDTLPVEYPCERLALGTEDPTLKAIEWLTPFGMGSRVVIAGPARAGKSETLRRLTGILAGREGLESIVVLAGVRPEEISVWQQAQPEPAAALSFAEPAEAQGRAVERAVERGRRVAARGGNALVAIDTLDGLHPHVARKALAAARKLTSGGSLTVIATASRPFGGETTVIALDATFTGTGRLPLDLAHSGTIRPELLVGEDGAEAIQRARAAVVTGEGADAPGRVA